MTDISVAMERIRSLTRAARTPFTGDPAAFLAVLSGHLESSAPTSSTAVPVDVDDMEGTTTAVSPGGLQPADLVRLDSVLRARFVQPAAAGNGSLLRPVDGELTSGFGLRTHPVTGREKHHDGIDLAAPAGTPIRAAADGLVSFAGERGGYGNLVIVDHPGGLQTYYAHQSHIGVTEGERVVGGQTIGAVGSTGTATGPHLHFEVREDGRPVDPTRFL